MEVGDAQSVELLHDIAEQGMRIAVARAVEAVARRKSHSTRSAPQTSASVLTASRRRRARFSIRSAIPVGALVRVVLQELVDQMAIGCHELDAVEACGLRILGSGAILVEIVAISAVSSARCGDAGSNPFGVSTTMLVSFQ